MRRQVSSVNRFERPFCARRISSVMQNRLASTPMNPLVLEGAVRLSATPYPNTGRAAAAARKRRSRRPRNARNNPETQRGPQGATSPCGPLPAHAARPRASPRARNRASIEKRPPRARRPALPQPRAAVLSAKAGLTAGFGMGPGDPRLCGRARGGRSPAASLWSLPGTPVRGDPGGRMAGTEEDHASRSVL